LWRVRNQSDVLESAYLALEEPKQRGDTMPKATPLSFAARTGDLLTISGIAGFDEKRELPDTFEA
jgi:hypothetical protein